MTQKIECQPKSGGSQKIKVRVIRSPLVNTFELRQIVLNRSRALVL